MSDNETETEIETERLGFRIGDDYYVEFADGEFIKEDENGNLFADTLIYKIVNGENVKVEHSEITPELHQRVETAISTFVNASLTQYLEEYKHTLEDDDYEEIIVEDDTNEETNS